MPATANERRTLETEPETPDPDLTPEGPSEPRRLPRVRREVWIGAGALLALVVALLSVGPIARSAVVSRAEALGLKVEVQSARAGFGVVHLDGITIRSPELPGLSASIAHVDVSPGITLSPRRIVVHGGSVRVEGAQDELEAELEAWRTAHARKGTGTPAAHTATTPVSVDGIDVTWMSAPANDNADSLHVWGARYERDAEGREAIGADLVRAAISGVRVDASRGRVVAERDGDHRVVTGASAASFVAGLDLDRRSPEERRTPAPPHAGNVPAIDQAAERVADRGPRLRAKIGRAASALSRLLRVGGKLAITGARFELHQSGQTLNVGPASVELARDADRVSVTVTSGDKEAGTPLSLHVTAPTARGPVEMAIAGGPLSLAALGVKERDMGLEDVAHADVEVNGNAILTDDGSALRVSGRSHLANLSILDPRLNADPVRGLELSLAGKVESDLDGRRVHVEDLQIGVGKIKLRTSGDLERADGEAKASLHAEIPLAACSDMLASIPRALVPLLAGVELKGTYAFSGDLALDTRHLGDIKVDWDTANECRFTRVPDSVAPARFSRPWVRTVVGADGRDTTIESGPGTPDWVPLFDITPYMATAVVVSEDAGFWVHHGFSQKAIQDSIRANLRAGKFLRGASTVSMQLAKNLYLRREKTLSRKLQEAVLTVLLEQTLTKEQILELYFNVIEFAPGLYGIGPAAEHYFKSRPQELSLGQSLYLVSILPNPKIHHFKTDGELSPMWSDYLRHLMTIAHKIHRIDDRELSTGLAEAVRLGMPSGHDPTAREPGDPSDDGSDTDAMDLGPAER